MSDNVLLQGDPLWYKDGIIYQVHVKAFRDSNGDGIGDFRGMIEKLDYIKNFGINILWLLPFYPSPMKDDGYDIADYWNVNPDYGTIEDFKLLLDEAHKRDIRVVTELVMNHTSDQHPWFQKSRRAEPGTPERNYYVWSETSEKYKEARIIFSDFESSNWAWDPLARAYYWHRFYSHQPDLNFENPEVHKMLLDVVDYWFDMGVDGLRLDAVPYLYEREGTNCENLPETHQFLKKVNSHISEKFNNKMLLAEANQWPEDAVAYFGDGDECQMAFHFPLMPRIYMSIQMEDRFPIIDILEQTPDIPDNCQWAMFLRNHDELTLEMVTDEERDYMYRFFAKDNRAKLNLGIRRRLAPLIENNRSKIKLMNILLFSFPGTPIIYYGDEIGMGDNFYLGDRNGVRTPMQWSPDRNAGFSDTNPQRLYLPVIIDPEYHYEALNVEVQQSNPSSLFWWMKTAVSLRKNYKAFGRGTIEFLSPSNPKILAFLRIFEEEVILVVANLSRFPQYVELDLSEFAGSIPTEMFSRNNFPVIRDTPYVLTLNSYDFFWFNLTQKTDLQLTRDNREIPEFKSGDNFMQIYNEEYIHLLKAISDHIYFSEWYEEREKKFNGIDIFDKLEIPESGGKYFLLIIKINYIDDIPHFYLLPIGVTSSEKANEIRANYPEAIIAKIKNNKKILFEGIYDEKYSSLLLKFIAQNRRIEGSSGTFAAAHLQNEKNIFDEIDFTESRLLANDERYINLIYDEKLHLKLYRKLEEGINPGVETSEKLNQISNFKSIPAYLGKLNYNVSNNTRFSLGLVEEYAYNQGRLWNYMFDSVRQYIDNVNALQKTSAEELHTAFILSLDLNNLRDFAFIHHLVGNNFYEMMMLLGERVGEMHLALNSITDDPSFAPENFSGFHQRSIFQSLRSLIRNTFRELRKKIHSLPEEIKNEAFHLFDKEENLMNYAGKILDQKISAKKIRIHGNLELKQVLFTGKDYSIINFEGQKSVYISERKLKKSALRDVASLVWSLYSAAFSALYEYKLSEPEVLHLEPFVERWWMFMSGTLLQKYNETVKYSDVLPSDYEHTELLLRIFILEKLFIELREEMNNEGDLEIPLKGIKSFIDIVQV